MAKLDTPPGNTIAKSLASKIPRFVVGSETSRSSFSLVLLKLKSTDREKKEEKRIKMVSNLPTHLNLQTSQIPFCFPIQTASSTALSLSSNALPMSIDMSRCLLQDCMFSRMLAFGSAMGCCYVVDSEGWLLGKEGWRVL